MNGGDQSATNWDWLKKPDVALELYNAERHAFYAWDAAASAWSKATGNLVAEGKELSEQEEAALKVLRERLDNAAKAYDIARRKLHEAWAA